MEDLLKSHKDLEKCYKKYTLEQVKQMTPDELKTLCIDERTTHAKNLRNLDIKKIIDERIVILKEQYAKLKETRREDLQNYFKL